MFKNSINIKYIIIIGLFLLIIFFIINENFGDGNVVEGSFRESCYDIKIDENKLSAWCKNDFYIPIPTSIDDITKCPKLNGIYHIKNNKGKLECYTSTEVQSLVTQSAGAQGVASKAAAVQIAAQTDVKSAIQAFEEATMKAAEIIAKGKTITQTPEQTAARNAVQNVIQNAVQAVSQAKKTNHELADTKAKQYANIQANVPPSVQVTDAQLVQAATTQAVNALINAQTIILNCLQVAIQTKVVTNIQTAVLIAVVKANTAQAAAGQAAAGQAAIAVTKANAPAAVQTAANNAVEASNKSASSQITITQGQGNDQVVVQSATLALEKSASALAAAQIVAQAAIQSESSNVVMTAVNDAVQAATMQFNANTYQLQIFKNQ